MDLLEYLLEEPEERRPERSPGQFVAFEDWSKADIDAILGLGTLHDFGRGAKVIEMGSEGERDLYIVVSGELEVYRGTGLTEKRLALLRAGELIGEMSFVDGQPRSANVRALTEAKVLRIRPQDLEALCEANPRIGLKFMQEIAKILSFRLRATNP